MVAVRKSILEDLLGFLAFFLMVIVMVATVGVLEVLVFIRDCTTIGID